MENGRPRVESTACTCRHCGKSFEETRSNIKRGRGKFCGRECFHAAQPGKTKAPYKWKNPNFTKPLEKACPVCGTKFWTGHGQGASKTKMYCSPNCRFAAVNRRCGKLCNKFTEAQAAYIAGIVDGEGSVMLIMRKSVRLPSVHLRLSVINTFNGLLRWFFEVTGVGTIHLVDNKKYGRSSKQAWIWKTHGEVARSLLEQILPYLIIKRKQAIGGIKFQKRLRDPALKADRSWQMDWLLKMKALNARGVKPQE